MVTTARQREQMKAWRERNRDRQRELEGRWLANNCEHHRAWRRAWQKTYRASHPQKRYGEAQKRARKNYDRRNPDRVLRWHRNLMHRYSTTLHPLYIRELQRRAPAPTLDAKRLHVELHRTRRVLRLLAAVPDLCKPPPSTHSNPNP